MKKCHVYFSKGCIKSGDCFGYYGHVNSTNSSNPTAQDIWFCHFHTVSAAAAAKPCQSCPTLSDPIDCSLQGSLLHGIFQANVLEWGAISLHQALEKHKCIRILLSQVFLSETIFLFLYLILSIKIKSEQAHTSREV